MAMSRKGLPAGIQAFAQTLKVAQQQPYEECLDKDAYLLPTDDLPQNWPAQKQGFHQARFFRAQGQGEPSPGQRGTKPFGSQKV